MLQPSVRVADYSVSAGTEASWRDLDVCRFLGSTLTAFPPADASWEAPIVKYLVKNVDSRLRPMWSTRVWQRSTGGEERRTYLCFAFDTYGSLPMNSERIVVPRVLLPTRGNGLGFSYHGPFIGMSVLDGLEAVAIEKGIPMESVDSTASRWRQEGAIGRYVPMASIVPEARRAAWEMRRIREYQDEWAGQVADAAEMGRQEAVEESVGLARQVDGIRQRVVEDRLQIAKEAGRADSAFVSHTLIKTEAA